ncbi:MAG: IS110 family transposase [Bifidobacterium longum]|nr:IS110 family transposase [Bifidobacterium longum]
MPGTGVRTASNIPLGIGGDIANFKSAAHLAAYAGIAPATGQSGTSIKGERPSRRGNKRLRNALWQSLFVASAKHPPSIAYYKRKREQGKHHNAADATGRAKRAHDSQPESRHVNSPRS